MAEKKRGVLLTVWLVLLIIASALGALGYLFGSSMMHAFFPEAPAGIFFVYGVLSLANVVFAIFLFQWKKWAFYGFCVIAVISFILNFFVVKVGAASSLFGLAGILILYLLLRPKWKYLK